MNSRKMPKGQSIIEVIVALAVVGLMAMGIVKISSSSVRNARYSNEQTNAIALAEKQIAELKAYAINEEQVFWNLPYSNSDSSGEYCYLVEATTATDEGIKLPTTAPRYVEGNVAQVKVYVYWGKKGDDSLCNIPAIGSINYDRQLEFDTLIVR